MYTCEHCGKTFDKIVALNGHKRIHTIKPKQLKPRCCCIFTKREMAADYLEEYQSKRNNCLHCGSIVPGRYKFCNSSCSASYNNKKRVINGYTVTETHKEKTRTTLRATRESKIREIKKPKRQCSIYDINESTIYSKIIFCNCKHCLIKFISRTQIKYCTDCMPLYKETNRNKYKFTFNVYDYPGLFDLDEIKRVGWYSRGGKAGRWNPDGLSRDHRVSVTEAIKNNYEPYYIKHPINCEIMPWVDNNKKKGKSSITYKQLVLEVDQYEMRKV